MRGDFSRLGPPPDEAVTGVWLQQGRPLLDADWNDLQHVLRRMAARTLDALLGGPAGPADDLGFEVRAHPRLALNADGLTGQRLTVEGSASLPFGGPVDREEVEVDVVEGGEGRPAILARLTEDFSVGEAGDRPYVVEVDLEIRPGAGGLILRRPGHVAVGLRGDGRLWLGGEAGDVDTAPPGPLGREVRLALVHLGHGYRLFADGEPVARWRGTPTGDRRGPALTIGADLDGSASLACRLDAVRLWGVRPRHGHLACRLVADLDLGGTGGRRVPDRTRFGNDGRIEGEPPAFATLDLRLGAGRYVVGGSPIANHRSRSLHLGAPSEMRGVGLVYLDVGERAVGALEDPALREVALGGADTVMHTRAEWSVGVLLRPDREAAWAAFHELAARERGDAEFEHAASPAGNSLYRVEVHDAGWCCEGPPGPRARAAAWRLRPLAADRLSWPPGEDPPRAGAPLLAFCEGAGPWRLRAAAGGSPGGIAVTGGPASWPAEEVGILPLASFKWSPNNAAAAFDVAGIAAAGDGVGRVQLASPGFNGLGLDRGDWVELSGPPDGGRGRLHPIAAFDAGLLQVDLGGWDGDAGGAARLLRRWGPAAQGADGGAYPAPLPANLLRLDRDVSVRFRPDRRYAAGEAWTLPLRQSEDEAWSPQDRRTGWRPADGPARAFAPLALVRPGDPFEVEDLRRSFRDIPSLSAVEAPRPPPPERHVDAAEASRWLARHLPGARLVGAGPPPPGFRATGEVTCRDAPAAARWHRLPSSGRGPGGPGRAVFAAGGVVFVEDGGPGAWRWTEHGRWTRLRDQPEARSGFALVAVGGGVALIGGASSREGRLCDAVDILVPGGDWRRLPCDATPGLRPAAALVGALLYVTGGFDDGGAPMRRCEAVDLRTGGAFEARPMRLARADHAMAAVGDTCWVVGGTAEGGREIAEAEAYDGALDRWRDIAPLKLPVAGAGVAVTALAAMGAAVAVAGGTRRGRALDEAALYAPDADRWTALARLPGARRGLALAAEPPGLAGPARLLAIGGGGDEAEGMMQLALERRLSLWVSEGDETWP